MLKNNSAPINKSTLAGEKKFESANLTYDGIFIPSKSMDVDGIRSVIFEIAKKSRVAENEPSEFKIVEILFLFTLKAVFEIPETGMFIFFPLKPRVLAKSEVIRLHMLPESMRALPTEKKNQRSHSHRP
ncbi:hypothetical protein AVEN_193385-1 [Araneus ventricosus]|uniref:Uncharacterized protein n=1 Tax=Araneus ventricosus TaxID=182803 RepID=A0A4Y2FBP9_ARAVE|nr:hypothetical protein AVEN_193385-1 [Araneus ventricosus]